MLNVVSSTLSQVLRSILGPLLFLSLYLNNIDRSIISRLLKFANDIKVFANVKIQDNVEQLITDLNAIYQWSIDCLSIWITALRQ